MRRFILVVTVAAAIWTVVVWGLRLASTPPLAGQAAQRSGQAWDVQITPVADTWIQEAYPPGIGQTPNATPQGAATALYAGWADVGINERAVLRFAVPTNVPDMELRRAELELDLVSASIGTFDPPAIVSGTMRLTLREVTAPWDEATLTGLDRLETGNRAVSADVAWGPCAAGNCGTARVDVLPLAKAWGEEPWANHGLVLDATGVITRASTGTSLVMSSRESERPPVLRLEHVNVPFYAADLQGRAIFDCGRGGVVLAVENTGRTGSGPFAVTSTSGARWQLAGLAAMATQDIFDPGSHLRSYLIDPDDVVRESNEDNNTVSVAIPSCPTPMVRPAWLPLLELRRGQR